MFLSTPMGVTQTADHPKTSPFVPSSPSLSSLLRRLVVAHADSVRNITEPRTGVEFTDKFVFQSGLGSGRHSLSLVGAGARRKRLAGFPVDVYALGLYTDSTSVAAALGHTISSTPLSQSTYDAFISAGIETGLRLQITFKLVTRDKFVGAIKERLEPLMSADADAAASCERFVRQFDRVELGKGREVCFHLTQGHDSVTTCVDGINVGTIRSRSLGKSLLTIYLGVNPVSEEAKNRIGLGLRSMAESTS